ncbi:MAG: cytochrome c3 family protein, partial [Bacteroidota bacterium]
DLDEADKEIINQRFDFEAVFKSNAFIGLVIFFFVAVGFKSVIDGLFTVGVQQGYEPKQPIAFSHEIHAGQYEIDCQYCHTGVRKSASANIPSANICMNCHSAIKTNSPEIKKIYAAIENDRPIEWVRVHNLPDLAYFNHSQHVQVGGLECQTCHGPIEEMEVVKQWSKLTMGWCINCHRETPLNTDDNGYYDKLVELHESAEDNSIFTVEDNGGLECAKCHY